MRVRRPEARVEADEVERAPLRQPEVPGVVQPWGRAKAAHEHDPEDGDDPERGDGDDGVFEAAGGGHGAARIGVEPEDPPGDEADRGEHGRDDGECGKPDVQAGRRQHREHERDEPGSHEQGDARIGRVGQGAPPAKGRVEDAVADGGEQRVQGDDAGDEPHQPCRTRIR